MTVSQETLDEIALSRAEYEAIVDRLGREPGPLELGLFGALWSEHCGYKHTKALLRTLPSSSERILVAPGTENAGVIDLGDRLAIAMKVESHNHPSAVEPFEGANIEAAALEFTGIKLDHPLRMAVSEEAALTDIFRGVRKALKANGCKRAILVGHNSSFDLGFLNAAVARLDMKRNPFHPFSSFDTATLAGLAYGQTVLAKACQAAGIDFDGREAHSARYDTEKTAELFCGIVNRWKQMGGWEDFND